MSNFWQKIIPVIIVFFLGFLLKRIKIFRHNDGDLLLKIVFNVTLPALVFLAISQVELVFSLLFLPIIAALVILVNYLVASFWGKRLNLQPATLGSFIIGSMIMNTGFVLPFILARYGPEALAYYTIFDFGNMLMIFTFGYLIAMKYGENGNLKIDLTKFLKLPPIWALILGVLFNLGNWEINGAAENILEMIGTPTVFLTMLALGCYFHPRVKNLNKIVLVFSIRILGGLALGLALSWVFGLEGIVRDIVIICSSAPVGYNTLVLSSLENLDKDFAASLVSISLILGIIYVPLLMFVL
ncbi:MAG: AEC family transporter [Candidatus Cloacimonadales bacterium]